MTPRLRLALLSGFPSELHESGKILTSSFIDASREVVSIIESFGKLFSPVVSDMKGNVDRLDAHYQKDVISRKFIEDMVLSEDGEITHSWLLWLKRALEMIERFFWYMLESEDILREKSDNVNPQIRQAYDEVLKPFHGFFLQNAFKLMYRYMPTRKSLLGSGADFNENINQLKLLQPRMKLHIDKINRLYYENNLNDKERV